ncbi:MAG TPA: catechol 1,2-dioxygenase [Prolixibacteraceae bacterium]|nr:catechol 1,2-dioxygenase [Prolixibacteraceae bacterium]
MLQARQSRNNLVINGEKGELVELLGKIKHQDCITPYKNAKVELWHCDGSGVYDNLSPEFKYRGTTFSDEKGNYSFQTVLPVSYNVGNGQIRPAHFHMMITAEGYQHLVTQLYFNGDKYIEKDAYANSEFAKRRILAVSGSGKSMKVHYDVSMAKLIPADPSAIDKLLGIYVNKADKVKNKEFFKRNNSLWLKNEVFGEEYRYIGNNTFEYAGMPKGMSETYTFEISGSGAIKCTINYVYENNEKGTSEYWKV